MEIVYIVFFIICMILFAIGFYNIGRRKTVQEKEINYQKEIKEKEKIELDLKNKQKQLQQIEKEYADKKQIIEDISSIAQREYNLREQALEEKYKILDAKLKHQYDNAYEELQERYKKHREIYENNINIVKQELQKLSDTKAATIEALQREEKLQKEKDNYRIILSKNEENDIELLYSIRPKLTHKRILDMLIWQTFVRDKLKDKMLYIFPKKDMTGIYKITNLKNNKCYIGQARKLQDRINQHIKHALYIDCPQGNKLYEAMQKDGIQNFTIELLEECIPEQLNEKEKYYISLYNAVDYGYNKTQGNKTHV